MNHILYREHSLVENETARQLRIKDRLYTKKDPFIAMD
jgi:hypothetical protein